MLNIDSIENGIVIDHITAGRGMRVYELLELHKLEASLYYGERKPPPCWEELALKARFARDPLPLEELQVLAADAAKLEANLKAELPTDRRLACQYLRGLF